MSTPTFIDVAYAADMLHISPDVVLEWVTSGRLRTYGGRATNPFVRTPDVMALATGLGIGATSEPPKRMRSAAGRVQTRLAADSKWGDVSPEDIRDWAARADPIRRQAARTTARTALERLSLLVTTLDDVEQSST